VDLRESRFLQVGARSVFNSKLPILLYFFSK